MDVSLFDRKYRIDEICREFEEAHYETEQPSIREFLDRVPEEDRDETLCELIAIDMEMRLEDSGDVPVNEYVSQWPDQTELIEQIHAEVVQQSSSSNAARTGSTSEATPADESGNQPSEAGSVEAGSAPRRIGDFRIVREIGRGGMGRVYEAVQESLQRRVALKILPQSAWLRDHGRERFQREARAIARLHHTNIVDVFGSGEDDGVPYFAMQLIDGQGLEQFVSACRIETETQPVAEQSTADFSDATIIVGSEGLDDAALDSAHATNSSSPPARDDDQSTPETSTSQDSRSRSLMAARIGCEIADALHYAHTTGVLHRDVKPSNILLDEHGTAWLTDFGLAKMLSDDHDGTLTEQGDVLGTLRYMAPETIRGVTDVRSDVFSLGLTLLELITLRPPFGKGTRKEVLQERLRGDAPDVGEFDSTVPRDLQTVIRKAVEVDPELRYQTAGELAADLNRVLNDEPIHARDVSLFERFGRWARRNKLIAGLLLATFTLLSVGLTASLLATEHFKTLEGEQRELVAEKTDLANEKGKLADRNAALAEQNAKLANAARTERDSVKLFASDVLAKQGLDAAEEQNELEALVLLAGSAAKSDGLDEERYRANVLRSRRLTQKLPHPILALPLKEWASDMMLHPQRAAVLVKYAQTNTHQLFEQSSPAPTVLPKPIGDDAALTWSADGRWLYAADKERVTALRYPELDQSELIVNLLDADNVSENVDNALPEDSDSETASQGPADIVTQLACDPSGRFLAMLRGSVVQIWDIENHRFACKVIQHQAPVTHVIFSPDSAWFLTVDASQHFHTFETKSFTGPDAQSALAFSGVHIQYQEAQEFRYPRFVNGGTALIARHGLGELEHWYLDARQSETFSTPAGTQVTCVEALGKNEYFVGGSDGGVIISSATNGPVTIDMLDGMGIEVRTAAYNSVSQQLAVGYASRPSEIWSVKERSLTSRLSPGAADTTFLKYSPDGKQLMIAGVRTYHGQAAENPSDIRVWEMPTPSYGLLTVRLGTIPHRAAFSSDSRFVAIRGGEGHVKVHDLVEGQQVSTFQVPHGTYWGHAIAFLPDQERLVFVHKDVNGPFTRCIDIWDWRTREHLQSFKFPADKEYLGEAAWSLSRDGKRMTIRITRNQTVLLNLDDNVIEPSFISDGEAVDWLQISPDGKWVAGQSPVADGKFQTVLARLRNSSVDRDSPLFKVGNRTNILSFGSSRSLLGVSFSDDLQLMATSSFDANSRVWDLRGLQHGDSDGPDLLHTIQVSSPVYSSRFSPDNTHLLTVCKGGNAQVWNVDTGQPVGLPMTAFAEIEAKFRPGHDEILTIDYEGNFNVWNWRQSRKLWPTTKLFQIPGTIWRCDRILEVSPDGRYAAIGGFEAMHIVDLTPLDNRELPSVNDLTLASEVISGQRLTDDGITRPLTPDEWHAHMRNLQSADGLGVRHWLAGSRRTSPRRLPNPARAEAKPSGHDTSVAPRSAKDIASSLARELDETLDAQGQQRLIELAGPTDDVLRELLVLRPDIPQLQLIQARRCVKQGNQQAATKARQRALDLFDQQSSQHADDQFLATQIAELLLDVNPVTWHPLEIQNATSKLGTTLTLQEDRSILASGPNPVGDVYSIEATTELKDFAAIRLEVLPDPSLPHHGPGRHPSGNFQLAAIRLFSTNAGGATDSDDRTAIPLSDAWASYTWPAPEIDVLGTISDDDQRVWHVWGRFGQAHEALFSPDQPVSIPEDKRVLIELYNHVDEILNLGRFRLSVTNAAAVELQRLRESIYEKRLSGHEALAAVRRELGDIPNAEKDNARPTPPIPPQ